MSDGPRTAEEAVELWLDERRRGIASDPAVFAARFAELGPDLLEALRALDALARADERAEAALDHGLGAPLDDGPLPERIGPFRIVREVGRGGMGVVLEAVEEPLGRRVALKILPSDALASASARGRFEREARLAARLEHPGLATVYGAGRTDGRSWIAMRFVDGDTLAARIAAARAAGRPCAGLGDGTPRGVARVLARVARALATAHAAGVVHRDVKPSNVLVAADGTPVLVDFGLALGEGPDERTVSRSGSTAGTPAYLAPELVSGERGRPDALCDVWALGVTLHECLALERPFGAPTHAALWRAIVERAAPDVRGANPAVPRDLAVVAAVALERDRSRRYASAAALADDLEAVADGRPIAARPVPLAGRVVRWVRREPRQAALAGALIAATVTAVLLAGAWLVGRSIVHAAAALSARERTDALLRDGYGFLATNWLPEAEAAFAHALALAPDNAEALAGRALALLQAGRDAEVEAALAGAPESPAFDSLRALARGETPAAEAPAGWLARATPAELFVDGVRLMRQHERAPPTRRPALAAAALERLDAAVERAPAARYAHHVQRTLAAWGSGDERAIRSASAALVQLWPDHERALFTAGLALYDLEPDTAIGWLERAVALDPGWGAPHQVLGNARMARGDLERAIASFERAIEIDPSDADALNSLGVAHSRLGRHAEAREAYRAALAVRPMLATWANLGLLEANAGGDPDEAEHALRTGLEGFPADASLRIALAEVLHRVGRGEEAVLELETLLGHDPGHARALELRAAWLAEGAVEPTAPTSAPR